MDMRFENRSSWREYQARLKRKEDSKDFFYRMRWAACALGVLIVLIIGINLEIGKDYMPEAREAETPPLKQETAPPSSLPNRIEKKDIRAWLPSGAIFNLEEKSFEVQVNRGKYRIDTSLDIDLQTHLLQKIKNATVTHMGLVAISPDTGKVLAMVGIDGDKLSENPCLDNSFPAASVFKIVTAGAAIDTCGYNLETPITFTGGKYTLYKSQLKETKGKYGTTLSLRDSFAQSVNPVFGKIGLSIWDGRLWKNTAPLSASTGISILT